MIEIFQDENWIKISIQKLYHWTSLVKFINIYLLRLLIYCMCMPENIHTFPHLKDPPNQPSKKTPIWKIIPNLSFIQIFFKFLGLTNTEIFY